MTYLHANRIQLIFLILTAKQTTITSDQNTQNNGDVGTILVTEASGDNGKSFINFVNTINNNLN